MPDKILHKRSNTAGSIPTTSSLDLGEIAINTNDGKIFIHKSSSAGESIQSALITDSTNTGSLTLLGSLILSGSLDINSGSSLDISANFIDFDFDLFTLSGSLEVTGSVAVTQGITGSLFGTSSWAQSSSRALTASYVQSPLPGGANTQIQYNSASILTGSSRLVYDYNNNNIILSGSLLLTGSTSNLTTSGSGFIAGGLSVGGSTLTNYNFAAGDSSFPGLVATSAGTGNAANIEKVAIWREAQGDLRIRGFQFNGALTIAAAYFTSGGTIKLYGASNTTYGDGVSITSRLTVGGIITGSTFAVSGSAKITNGLEVTGSATISNLLTLTPQHPLPSSPPTGTLAVSSSVPPKIYFYDGTTWNALY